jgi:hypothetical protein
MYPGWLSKVPAEARRLLFRLLLFLPPRLLLPPPLDWDCETLLLMLIVTGLDVVAGLTKGWGFSSGGNSYCSQHSSNFPPDIKSKARLSSICNPRKEVSSAVFPRLRRVLNGSSTQR